MRYERGKLIRQLPAQGEIHAPPVQLVETRVARGKLRGTIDQQFTRFLKRIPREQRQTALAAFERYKKYRTTQNYDELQNIPLEEKSFFVHYAIMDENQWLLTEFVGEFSDLNKSVAHTLVARGLASTVIEGLDYRFGEHRNRPLFALSKEDTKKILLRAFEQGLHEPFLKNLGYFNNELPLSIAEELLNESSLYSNTEESICNHIDAFEENTHKAIALSLIHAGKIFASGYSRPGDDKPLISRFKGLDVEVAKALINRSEGIGVLENLDAFSGVDERTLLSLMIDHGDAGPILRQYKKFKKTSPLEITKQVFTATNKVYEEFDDIVTEENDPYFEKCKSIAKRFFLKPGEVFALLQKNGDDYFDERKPDEKNLTEIGEVLLPMFRDEANITAPLKNGAEIFGYHRMFKYLDRKDLNRHDGLHAFGAIIDMYEASTLEPRVFFDHILQQVSMDDGIYDEGTAHHRLNTIAQTFNANIENTITRAASYVTSIPLVADLAQAIRTPGDVFASWKNFRRYHELTNVLQKAELLEQLMALKAEGKDALFDFIQTLAFHPGSSVDMQKVFQFWQDPKTFLELPDPHAEETHELKKPSHYVEIPYLDLTAEELRDALVEGSLDQIQAFPPHEVRYVVGIPDASLQALSLKEVIARALKPYTEPDRDGKNVSKNPLARAPGKLFARLKSIFKEAGYSVPEALADEDVLAKKISPEHYNQILQTLYDPRIGIPCATETMHTKVSLKSDPEGVLAGNDTACCMPFGQGKTNLYMFNPVTAQFTLQLQRSDRTFRTIAQSVLTKDMDVDKKVPDLLDALEQSDAALAAIVPESILTQRASTLACDNAEVAQNYRSGHHPGVIEEIYQDFFSDYISRHSNSLRLDPEQIVIGMGYSSTMGDLKEIENTYMPRAPLSYSDKTGENVYRLEMQNKRQKFPILKREVIDVKQVATRQDTTPQIPGISELTFEDTIPIAYLEGKAYAGAESLLAYLHNLENGLIAKDIANAHKDRPNLSLKYTDPNTKKIRGYFFAYEGKRAVSTQTATTEEESIIYVTDFAVAPGAAVASKALLQGFLELYKRHYIDQHRPLPIVFEARDTTSYKLLMGSPVRPETPERAAKTARAGKLEILGKEIGVTFQVEKGEPFGEGSALRHPITLRVDR